MKKTMSNPKNNPELPEIPSLSQEQLNRLLAADWLETVAKMMRKGAVTGFAIAWSEQYQKPVGKVEMSSIELTAPLESKLLRDIEEAKAVAARQVPYFDLSEDAKNHAKCENPTCLVCNNPNKA